MQLTDRVISDDQIFGVLSASFWKRLLAWLVDQALLGAVIVPIYYLKFGSLGSYLEIIQIFTLANLVYFTSLEGVFGQSLGKKLLGILVYEEGGSRVSFTMALFRRIGLVIPLFFVADGIAILITSRNQRIFDIIAGTVVVKKSHESDAERFLRGEDITDSLVERGVMLKISELEKKRDQNILESLRGMKDEMEEEFKRGEIDEDLYLQLKRKYESRIRSLKKRIENNG